MAHAGGHFMNMHQSKALLGRGDTAGDEISDESSLHAQDTKATIHYINGPCKDAAIPRPGMTLVKGQVAVVITDPPNGFLSPRGVTRGDRGAKRHGEQYGGAGNAYTIGRKQPGYPASP